MSEIREAVREFPESAGVYLMKDRSGKILYVGKAINLKKRVSSYFLKNRDPKTQVLVSRIDDIEFIVTESEYEALLLENILIKKWNPRYNIRLKDGKSYPVIRITNEEFPRVFKTRRIIQDGSRYFGPFASAGLLNVYMETIEKMFPLRKCRGRLKKRSSPCLYYHIGRCKAPCAGKVSAGEYNELIKQVEELLSGDNEHLLNWLKKRMEEASERLDYERAAEFRDALSAAEGLIDEFSQRIIDFNDVKRDYIAFSSYRNNYAFAVFQMRGGRLIGRDLYRTEFALSDEEALEQFIARYYSESGEIPDEIYFPLPIDISLLKDFFLKEKTREPGMFCPEGGQSRSILKMAEENAWQDVMKQKRQMGDPEGIEKLKEVLGLKKLPKRIEGFDIAHLAGKYPTASLITFMNGVPDKNNYRRYHIKTLQGGIDDFGAVREAVSRRYSRLLNERLEMPDLVLIDGGQGQVNAAKSVLDALGLEELPVAGLAKKNEEIYFHGRPGIISLPEGDPALRVLQYVRDETHRFATAFSRKLREKDTKFSVLEQVSGIGPAKSRKLMEYFGTVSRIAESPEEELMAAAGISRETALKLKKEIKNK